MVAEMIAEMQHYAVSCSHVWRQPLQPYHAAMCSMVHTVHTCSVQSRVGHEHHRDAESQVERRRLHGAAAASRASDFDPHLMWLASKDVQRKCSGVRAFYFALSLSKSNFVWTWWMFGQSNCRWWRQEKEEEARACSCLAPMNASHDVAEK
jgi:hypothetical protein